MRTWDNQEVAGRGTKFCLVIDPEDGTQPIRTYGWSIDEVLEKVARTAEAAQAVINRQRAQSTSPSDARARTVAAADPTAVAGPRQLSPDEIMTATADLSNPAKSQQALKTLLRGAGLDVDRAAFDEGIRRVGAIAQEWEKNNPDFPSDRRNQQLLMNTAALRAGTVIKVTAAHLDAAYTELLANGMLFDADSAQDNFQPTTLSEPPNGNSAPRTERPRGATSYRANALRSPVPAARREPPKYTDAQLDAMPSAIFRDKMENEPGFAEWYNKTHSKAATA